MKKPGKNHGPHENAVGRPTLLNDEVQAKITQALRAGNFRAVACQYAGISQRVFFDWMRKGKEETDTAFVSFRRAVIEAEKAAEIRAVALIMRAAESDPRHAEWWLSHRFPGRWADKSRHQLKAELSGPKGGPINLKALTDEELRDFKRIAERIAERTARPRED